MALSRALELASGNFAGFPSLRRQGRFGDPVQRSTGRNRGRIAV